jgi:hypothetical protein
MATAELQKVDVYQFGSVSNRRTLLVLPSTASAPSAAAPPKKGAKATKADGATALARVVVGDDAGVVTCLALRAGGAADVEFQVQSGARVECVALGGTTGSRERIFFSAGDAVRALSRKGKEFFSLSAPTADPIRHLAIDGAPRLYAAGDFSFIAYDAQGVEASSATVPDRVGALTLARPSRAGPTAPVDVLVGCADRVVRLIGGGSVLAELPVEGPVTALVGWSSVARAPDAPTAAPEAPSAVPAFAASTSVPATFVGRLFGGGGGSAAPVVTPAATAAPALAPPTLVTLAANDDFTPRFFVYGTASGAIGCIALTTAAGAGPRLLKVWTVSSSTSPVVSLAIVSATGDGAGLSNAWPFAQGDGSGVGDVAVGREDGTVEVLSAANEAAATTWAALGAEGGSSANSAAHAAPSLFSRARLSEAVRALGVIPSLGGGAGCDILALTFSGRLVLLRLAPANDADASVGRRAQLESLRADIARLRVEVDAATAAAEDALAATEMGGNGHAAALLPSHFFPMAHRLEASHSWTLDPADAAYTVRERISLVADSRAPL